MALNLSLVWLCCAVGHGRNHGRATLETTMYPGPKVTGFARVLGLLIRPSLAPATDFRD